MKRYGIIYMITNKLTEEKYVGQTTKDFSERLHYHITEKRNRHISNALRKYGIENFYFEEICSCDNLETLNNAERYFVEHFNTMFPNGYNHRAGGSQNGICSDELRRKISAAKTGKPNLKRRGEIRSEEQRIKISRGLGGNQIKATNLITGEVKIYDTAHSTKKDGHNPSNVVSICKKNSYRIHSKNWKFEYINANQSGSDQDKTSSHAQRLDVEPAIAE